MTLFNAWKLPETRDALGIHNPFENPTIPLSSIGLDEVFGALSKSDSGESVTQDTSLSIPTVFRCVGLLSTVIAGCPLRVYRSPGKKELFPAVLDKANTSLMYTYFGLMELIVTHLCLWGNAYVLKVRAKNLDKNDPGYHPKGSPGEDIIADLRPINPSRVTVRLFKGEKIFEVIRLDENGKIDANHKPLIYTSWEIMHIPAMGYDGLVGLSPIEYATRTLGTSIAVDKLAAKFYVNGSMLGGVIKVKAPLASQVHADEIRRRWVTNHAGVSSAGDVAVLDAETDYQPITIPPDQLQFLQSRGWQTVEIARLFGIPPHLVGDIERSTSWGSGIEQQNQGFVAYTVSGWTNRIEQHFTREIINTRKQYAEFDLDRLMRGITSERYAAYAIGVQWGWLSRNEVRIKENMVPLEGLDDMLVPLNMNANSGITMGDPANPGPNAVQKEPVKKGVSGKADPNSPKTLPKVPGTPGLTQKGVPQPNK